MKHTTMRAVLGLGAIALGLFVLGGAAFAGTRAARETRATGARAVDVAVTPAEATALGTKAYLYGFPLTEFNRTQRIETSVRCPDRLGDSPLNTFSTATRFARPSSRVVVAPNVDTLYSIAHLDLGRGPVVLSHPAMGKRYFVFELLDPYTNVVGYVGSRTTGSAAGRFAITWTGHPGKRIVGTKMIRTPYRYVWVIGRTLAGDATDQRRAVALMRGYTLTPPGGRRTFASGCRPGKPISEKPVTGLAFLDELGAALKDDPPPARDQAFLGQLRRVGVGSGLQPQRAGLSPATLAALVSGVDQQATQLPTQARDQVVAQAIKDHGWYTPPADLGDYGTDYTTRAQIAAEGLGANTPAEAIYPVALTDSSGQLLNGATDSYELTFMRGHLPPAKAFWSLTMYDEAGFLISNPIHRYAIGPDHPPLRKRPDGDVVVILSHARPSEPDVNWLPAPAAPFRLNLRLYWPRQSALAGRWTPPDIESIGSASSRSVSARNASRRAERPQS